MYEKFHRSITVRKFPSISLITRLALVSFVGLFISACSSTMEGMGKDLQTMGKSMGGSSSTQKTQAPPQSQTQGKDVIVTPVK
jgi:predicted small secreted protein